MKSPIISKFIISKKFHGYNKAELHTTRERKLWKERTEMEKETERSNNKSYYSLIAWWSNEFWQMVTPLHWTFHCRAFWMGQLSLSLLWRGLLDYIRWFVLIKQHVIVVLFRPNWWLCSEWVYISFQTRLALTKGSFPLPNLNSTSSTHTMLKCHWNLSTLQRRCSPRRIHTPNNLSKIITHSVFYFLTDNVHPQIHVWFRTEDWTRNWFQ